MVNEAAKSLGEVIREARVAKGLGLRELARNATMTPSYLSDIENDRRVPAEEVLRTIGRHLDLGFDDLMARAGRLGDEAMRYMSRTPAVGVLMRKLSAANAPAEIVEKLAKDLDRKIGKTPKGGG
jgi:ribosome-binding protein aMBF1 (putative translation factor)